MKNFLSCIAVMIFPFVLISQTNVDKVTSALDSMSTFSMNDWKMSPDLKNGEIKGDPTQHGFDDSQWQTLKIAQSVYPDSCWLRREIVLPEYILGKRVGGTIRLTYRSTITDTCGSTERAGDIFHGMELLF